jgi:hypothetical protein
LVKRFDQNRQGDLVIVPKAPGGLRGGKGGHRRDRRGGTRMQFAGGMKMLLHQNGVPILQSRFHRGCKESIRTILGGRQLV